jgi:hypothetical protein
MEITMEEETGLSLKVMNRPFAAPEARKSSTFEMEMLPSRALGPMFLRETARMPGALAMDLLISGPSRMGFSDASPINPRKERIRAVVLGSRAVVMVSSAAPPVIIAPSILAEQEAKAISRGIENNKTGFLKIVII